jgi:Lon protease-like protein
MTLRIFEDRYLRMLADRATSDPVFVVSLIQAGREVGDEPRFHPIGTTARLATLNALSTNLVDIVVVGQQRIALSSGNWSRGYATAEGTAIADQAFDMQEARRLLETALGAYNSYGERVARLVGQKFKQPDLAADPIRASFDIAARLPLHTWEQQQLLEERNPLDRLASITTIIDRERALMTRGGVVGIPVEYPGERFMSN